MTDRERDKLNFSEFLNQQLEIILDNGMHYTGKIISIGGNYLKIVDKYNKIVFIVIKSISTMKVNND